MKALVCVCGLLLSSLASFPLAAQSLGNAGTIEGTVTDPSGLAIVGATVEIRNPITKYQRSMTADANGAFRFTNIPPNTYHIQVSSPGFTPYQQDVNVRSSVPIPIKASLVLAGASTNITVQGENTDLEENVAYAHHDVDREELMKLPLTSPGTGLSDAIAYTTPGVVKDSNGIVHALGDHAQTSYVIDGQVIADQQSKLFSTQIPPNAIQSMELVTGAANAEFGDKTSLVVNATTRSGLGQKGTGSFVAHYGSFGTVGEEAALGAGTAKFGNFVVLNTERSGRFLDSPEFRPFHDVGTNATIFDRIDWEPNGKDFFHLNIFGARNWFQIPNTYDQPNQDQRQRVTSFNFAPGYQHTFSSSLLLTANLFVRQDRVNYYPSRDAFDDLPATLSQDRHLTNYGLRSDLSYVKGIHNFKAGLQIMQTRLKENFSLGITDPAFNSPCLNQNGAPATATNTASCAGFGLSPNPDVVTGLIPFDLTRGGSPLVFHGSANINQYAFFAQDQITIHNLSLNAGLRFDQYNGLTEATGVQPRFGLSYQFKKTGTVLRAAYSRTFETPYNENLVLSSAAGGALASNVFGAYATAPLKPGTRNQFNTGLQQTIGKYILVDADYFWKFTDNAYDFDSLFNTPIHFPISWRKSKLDGVSARVSTPDIHGFTAYVTLGHTRARFFGPEVGGLIFNSPVSTGVFRIDHDQEFEQVTNLRYQRGKNGPWIGFTWRFDSGMVAGAIPDLETVLQLTAAQQAAIGFSCGGVPATLGAAITACPSGNYTTARVHIPAPGTETDDRNPPRIAPRNLFDLAVGTDNLFHTERGRATLRLSVENLSNEASLYNFLSTFSGTHFVTPRSYQAQIGWVF